MTRIPFLITYKRCSIPFCPSPSTIFAFSPTRKSTISNSLLNISPPCPKPKMPCGLVRVVQVLSAYWIEIVELPPMQASAA